MINNFFDLFTKRMRKKQDQIQLIPGEIGDLNNQVYVPDRPYYVYVRISERVAEVYNNKVDPALDLKVWVTDPSSPPYFQEVFSEREKNPRYGEDKKTRFHVQPHGPDHEYPNPDTVWIQGRQILPFRVSSAGEMSIHIYRNLAYLGGQYRDVNIGTEDLSIYGIAGDLAEFAKYLLVEISASGVINIVEGDQVDYADLALTDIPDPTDGAFPLAAIRIYSGQTEIIEARTNTDLIDLRFAYSLEKPNMILGHLSTDYIDFNTAAIYSDFAGRMGWNAEEYTINIVTGLGPVLQVGQELYTIVYNDTGSEIKNATAVYPVGAIDGRPSVSEADSASHVTIAGIILVTTMDIPDQSIGIVATILGKVRGIDTTSFNAGETLWIAPSGTGLLNNLTNIKPEFPNYVVQIGGVNVVDEFDGVLQLAIEGKAIDTLQNYHNGTFRETFKFNVTSNGTIITGTLIPANGHPNMTGIFSDGFAIIDTDPGATIELTPGTDIDPQEYFIYIPKSTKVLTVSTGDFPYDEEIIQVAHVSVQSAATVQDKGARRNQNYNNQIQDTNTGWGGRARENDRTRQDPSVWKSGVEGGSTIISASSPDDVYLTTTAGIIYQLGRHVYDARDLEAGDDLIVFNDSVSPNKFISNLNLVTLDSSGVSLTNRYFSIVLICSVSSAGDPDQWGINLPSNSYTSSANAISDALNYTNYNIPSDMGGVAIRATRYTFGLSASGGGTWTLYDTDNGIKTETSFGGGGGGTGATTFDGLTDTPSSKVSQGLKLVRVNSGETALEYVVPGVLLAYTTVTVTTGNVAAISGNLYIATLAGLTADRDFNLPTPAAAGEYCGVLTPDADDTYALIIKANSIELTRLIIAGEVMIYISTGTGAGDWEIYSDGRIGCKTFIYDDNGTSWAASTLVTPNFSTTDLNTGNCADLTNDRIKIRRSGLYSWYAQATSENDISSTGVLTGQLSLVNQAATDLVAEKKSLVNSNSRISVISSGQGLFTITDQSIYPNFVQNVEATFFDNSRTGAQFVLSEILP